MPKMGRGWILAERHPAFTDVFYCNTYNSNVLFPYCSICTEQQRPVPLLQCMYRTATSCSLTTVYVQNSNVLFPYCSICTELHCRLYCCQIQTDIVFVTFSNVPTSRVTFTVTFAVFGRFVVVH